MLMEMELLTSLTLSGGPATSIVDGPGGVWITENAANIVSRLSYSASAITRDPYPAPSAFGLKNLTVGPDNNIWAVGTNAHKVVKASAHYVTKASGGRGGVRELIDLLLDAKKD